MVKKRKLCPQSVWDEPALQAAFAEQDIKPAHIIKAQRCASAALAWPAARPPLSTKRSVRVATCRFLAVNLDAGLDEIPELPLKAQVLLRNDFARSTSTVEQCQQAAAGDTCKLLIRLQDGLQVESVIMHYDTSGQHDEGLFTSLLHSSLLQHRASALAGSLAAHLTAHQAVC